MKVIRNTRKAQHEMVGFILIVVIVVIIGLFLLVFYLRQPATESKSLSVQNFLQAGMLYTTDCYLTIEPLDLEGLIKSCFRDENCLNEKRACEVLNETLPKMISESWLISPDKPENSYSLDIYYEEDAGGEEAEKLIKQDILSLREGNCTGSKTGAEHFFHYDRGDIIIAMELCYT